MDLYRFVEREKAHHPVIRLCRAFGIAPSGYWAWRTRGPSPHAQRDAQLHVQIQAIQHASHATYGAPRVHAELRPQGVRCARKRVARLMRQADLVGCHRRRRRLSTTQRAPGAELVPDLVQRTFAASDPNRIWVADLTQIPTAQGILYLAVILDVWSRRVVGWAMDTPMPTELVLRALTMAMATRRPPPGLIHHSDHGSQYTAQLFTQQLRQLGLQQSCGSVGDCYDNALMESFFASLKAEALPTRGFASHAEARTSLFRYLEGFYNRQRRHSALGYLSPNAFERRHALSPSLS